MEEAEDVNTLPEMPEPGAGGRRQSFESLASTLWSLSFLFLSSSTVVSELPPTLPTALFIALPAFLANLDDLLLRTRSAPKTAALYALHALLPPVLALHSPVRPNLRAAAAFVALCLPLELRVLPTIGTGRVAIWGGLTASLGAVVTFGVLLPFPSPPQIGYTFKVTAWDVLTAGGAGAVLGALSIGLARAVGYGRFVRPTEVRAPAQAAIFAGIYFVALGDEVLFRGVAQNVLEREVGVSSSPVALLVAAGLFGAAHLKSKGGGHMAPNWRAAVLALFSGAGCGLVWRATGKSTASALTQAMVTYVLRLFYMKQASL